MAKNTFPRTTVFLALFSTGCLFALSIVFGSIGVIRNIPEWTVCSDKNLFIGHSISVSIITTTTLITVILFYVQNSQHLSFRDKTKYLSYNFVITISFLVCFVLGLQFYRHIVKQNIDVFGTETPDLIRNYWMNWNWTMFTSSAVTLAFSFCVITDLVVFSREQTKI